MNFGQSIKDKALNYILNNMIKTLGRANAYSNSKDELPSTEKLKKVDDMIENEMSTVPEEDRIVIEKRSMIEKLYSMEQLIKTFDEIFPESYSNFLARIEILKKEYQMSLKEYLDSINNKTLTFEIDPDRDYKMVFDVMQLEKDIDYFIENSLKFDIISKRVQKLCLKLNILYNTSIFHYRNIDKAKVLTQIEKGKENLLEIIEELKFYNFFVSNKQKREYLLDFISYADYLIFKCVLRNSACIDMESAINNLFIKSKFSGLDYIMILKNFILEELENLLKLLELLKGEDYYLLFLRKIQKLQNFKYEASIVKVIESVEFWKEIFEIEHDVLNCICILGYDKERAQILLLDRFDTGIDEKEIFLSAKSSSCLAIADLFYNTQNINSAIVLNIISSLSDDITYKEVYFILLLFDVLDLISSKDNISKSFLKNISRQVEKYGSLYSKSDLEDKKLAVLRLSKEKNIYTRILYADTADIVRFSEALDEGNFDFIVSGDAIYLNSYYFQGLENVIKSLNDNKTYKQLI